MSRSPWDPGYSPRAPLSTLAWEGPVKAWLRRLTLKGFHGAGKRESRRIEVLRGKVPRAAAVEGRQRRCGLPCFRPGAPAAVKAPTPPASTPVHFVRPSSFRRGREATLRRWPSYSHPSLLRSSLPPSPPSEIDALGRSPADLAEASRHEKRVAGVPSPAPAQTKTKILRPESAGPPRSRPLRAGKPQETA